MKASPLGDEGASGGTFEFQDVALGLETLIVIYVVGSGHDPLDSLALEKASQLTFNQHDLFIVEVECRYVPQHYI